MTPTTETAETLARKLDNMYSMDGAWPRLKDIEGILIPHFTLLADTQLQLEAIRELADTDSIKRTQAKLLGEAREKIALFNKKIKD